MKLKVFAGVLVLLLAMTAVAQTPATAPAQDPPHGMMTGGPGGMHMGMMDMPWLHGPHGILDQWWKNPRIVNDLQLTEAQQSQLEQASITARLAMIDAGANALKALTRAQGLLDAPQFDETAFNQQVDAISTSAASLVKTMGQMVLTTRKVLSPEQWRKLQALRHEPGPMMMQHRMPPGRPAAPPHAPAAPPK